MRCVTPLLLSAVLIALAGAPVAQGAELIVPFHSVGPLRLGMSEAAVRAVVPYKPSGGCRCGAAGRALFLEFGDIKPGQLDLIVVKSPKYKTQGGVGVGSSVRQLKAAFPDANCVSTATEGGGALSHFKLKHVPKVFRHMQCQLGMLTGEKRGTDRRCKTTRFDFEKPTTRGYVSTKTVGSIWMHDDFIGRRVSCARN